MTSAHPGERPDVRRFAVAGFVATVLDVGVAVGLVELGMGRVPADVLGLALAAVVARILHHRYALRGDVVDRWIRQPPVFVAVAVVAGSVDLIVFVSLGEPVLLAKIAAVGFAAVVRLGAYRLVLFRVVRREQSSPVARPPAPGDRRLSIVVPAYREAERIGSTIREIRSQLAELDRANDLEVVVVDDGSRDGTAAAATAAGAHQVVVQPENRGKGAAVRAGVAAASGRTVAFTDADLAYAPRQLLSFLAAIESGYDVAIGNRHHEDAETLVGTSALRSFGSRGVNMATNLLLLGNYRDTQSGCKAFRSDAARWVVAPGRIDGFAFDIEVLHLVERYGLTMIELPVEVVNSDTSTVRAFRDGIGVVVDILRIRRAARRGHYPDFGDQELPNAEKSPMVDERSGSTNPRDEDPGSTNPRDEDPGSKER
ncbi:MAG: glycosyltransferase [Actinomycetota bacterium]